MPMRTPVKLPGPRPKASASSSLSVVPLSVRTLLHQRQDTLGMFAGTNFEMSTKGAIIPQSRGQASVAVSIAKIRMGGHALVT